MHRHRRAPPHPAGRERRRTASDARPTVGRALGEAILGGERAGRFGALGELVVDPALYATPTVVDWASGAAMLVDRRCHDALGGWDESFFLYAEESDLCLRAADHGWRTRYTPGAVVHHDGGHGERTPLRELMMVNKAVLYGRRHGPLPTVAYRSALVLQEGLRAWRGPYQPRRVLAAARAAQPFAVAAPVSPARRARTAAAATSEATMART